MFDEYPTTNFHDINLDKFLKAIKNLLGGKGGQYLEKQSNIPFDYKWKDLSVTAGVQSVNGQTGNVLLTAADVNALPDTTTIPQPSNNTPENLGTANRGTSTRYARQDHVHNMPTAADVGALPSSTTIPLPGLNVPENLGTATRGTSTRYARQDHVHNMPTAADVGALPSSTTIPSAANANPADLGTAAVGTSDRYARQDHVHKMPTAADVGALPSSTTIPSAANANPADLGTAAVGTSDRYARQDHVHKMPSASDVGALPSSTTIPSAANANPADLGTAAKGTSTRYARQDHVHNMPTAADVGAIGTEDAIWKTTVRTGGTGTSKITISSGTNRGLLFISAGTATRNGLYIVHGGSTGTISCVPVLASNVLTFDTSITGQLAITNSSAVYIYALWMENNSNIEIS